MKYMILDYASQRFFDDMSGDDPVWTPEDQAARAEDLAAARRATNRPRRRHLRARATRLPER